MTSPVQYRQIRAAFTSQTITVYQAYRDDIADAALAAGTFVAPFSRGRATWLKPSFLWMAYRCGWATKVGQERVLAVQVTHGGLHWALGHSCLSHYDQGAYPDATAWRQRLRDACVRIQWDPERGLRHEPLAYRSIQIGLTGEAVSRYADEWIVSIADETPRVIQIRALLANGHDSQARALLPDETPYPLTPGLASIIGASA
jgi:pre-mRNA-splicing factor ATP-dependent RNA helicase DHX16